MQNRGHCFSGVCQIKKIGDKNMGYVVVGIKNGRPYVSRSFRTPEAAIKHGYDLTYNPDGNTKRRDQLVMWHIEPR